MRDRSSTGSPSTHSSICIDKILVRELSGGFERCLRVDASATIDLARARAQHAAYVEALRATGVTLVVLPGEATLPDCVFIEDTVVVLGAGEAVLMRPGAPARRGEVAAVEAVLRETMTLHDLPPNATVDGGDVLRAGGHLFIGRSERTNIAGARALAVAAERYGLRAVILEARGGLHLKSACTLADESTLVHWREAEVDTAPFAAAGLECVAVAEHFGANVLALGEGRVLVSAAAPRTSELLAARGLRVVAVEASELHAADGALTCPSVRIPIPGSWAT